MSLGKYNKLWFALAAALVAGANQLWGVHSAAATLVIGLAGALGVFQAENKL